MVTLTERAVTPQARLVLSFSSPRIRNFLSNLTLIRVFPRHVRRLLLALLLAQAGCAYLSPRYLNGTPYERAMVLYENGFLSGARNQAGWVAPGDPDHAAAERLAAEIDALAARLSRLHLEAGEDYERAGIYGRALREYSVSLGYDPSNAASRQRAEALSEAVREGRRPAGLDAAFADATDGKERGRKERRSSPEGMAAYHYQRGKASLDAGLYARAMEELSAAVKYVPDYMDAADLLVKCRKERDAAVERHLKQGIGFFQAEEMDSAIREWDAVLDLDPANKTATDYKSRTEVIMERLKDIRQKQSVERPL
jgi:tetratricopeptide (TPR) repeat protein